MQAKSNIDSQVYFQILNMFISGDKLRPEFLKSFYINNLAMATDAYCMCFFNKKLVPNIEAYSGLTLSKNIRSVIPSKRNFDFRINIYRLSSAIDKCPLIDEIKIEGNGEKCDCCKGEGEVEFEFEYNGTTYQCDDTCPICDGQGTPDKEVKTGKMIPDPSKCIKIKESTFRAEFLMKLVRIAKLLIQNEIILTHQTKPHEGSIFKIGEVEVLMMPTQIDDISKEEFLVATIE